MAQPLPITFADLPVGLEPLSLFDQQFQASTDGAYLKDDSVPLSALVTGTSGLAVGVAAFLGAPSSENLAAALTDKTGTGVAVFSNSPALVTPSLGTPSDIDLTNATGLPPSTGLVDGTDGYALIGAGGSGATFKGFLLGGTGATTRTWVSKLADIISVKDFGAAGDGVTDDAAAIQAAITYAYSLTSGSLVYMPAGEYVVGSQVSVPTTAGKQMVLAGAGRGATIVLIASGLASPAFSVGATSAMGSCNTQFRDFTISGANTKKALYLNNANDFDCDGVAFSGVYIAAELNNSFYVSFTKCVWQSISLYGIVSDTAAHGLRVTNCGFYNGDSYDIILGGAISFNVVIRDNDFEGGTNLCQFTLGVNALIFEGNYCEGYAAWLVFAVLSSGVRMNGNNFSGGTAWTINNIAGGQFCENVLYNQNVNWGATLSKIRVENNALAGTSVLAAIPYTQRLGREVLTANRTYFVGGTGASDSNDGLTSGTAFLTLNHARDVVAALDRSIFSVTVTIAAGTFTGGLAVNGWGPGSGTVTFNGAGSTTIISTTALDAINVKSAKVTVTNMKVTTTTSGSGLRLGGGADVTYGGIEFGACADAHIWNEYDARLECSANYTISGSAPMHLMNRYAGAVGLITGKTITLTGTPAFSNCFCNVQSAASVDFTSCTFSGSATGVRYKAILNGVLNTAGAGATYLPGDTVGTTSGGGQYG